MSAPIYLDNEKIITLLPMGECIEVMDRMFRGLAAGEVLQPLRHLMWLPDRSGLLGMMPAYADKPRLLGIKIITIFHANREAALPSHQGLVTLFDAQNGAPLLVLDAAAITAIRTAAVSALATRILSRPDSTTLAILGTGEQAERHAEAIPLVRSLRRINLWGRNPDNAVTLAKKLYTLHGIPVDIHPDTASAVKEADIICTVTSAREPILRGDHLPPGTHLNVVGSCTPNARELDTAAILRSSLFTDCYESLFNEAGDFLIPKKEGAIDDNHVKGELGEVLTGQKPGRTNDHEITLFKSLGIAAEDIYAAGHIYDHLPKK
jgi:ornithine cyclodeaminase